MSKAAPETGFGIGFYSFPDAARFLHAKPADLRRWLKGYTRSSVFHEPLWRSEMESVDPQLDAMTFHDLLELRFVKLFRQQGVPLPLIRATIEEAKLVTGHEFPLTSLRFQTDGRRIFARLQDRPGEWSLVDLVKHQNVIDRVVSPSLRKGIEFDNRRAARWFPVEGSKVIVLDPERRFGQPIIADHGVPTVALANAVRAEKGDERRVARMFDVPLMAVRKAVAFEARVGHA